MILFPRSAPFVFYLLYSLWLIYLFYASVGICGRNWNKRRYIFNYVSRYQNLDVQTKYHSWICCYLSFSVISKINMKAYFSHWRLGLIDWTELRVKIDLDDLHRYLLSGVESMANLHTFSYLRTEFQNNKKDIVYIGKWSIREKLFIHSVGIVNKLPSYPLWVFRPYFRDLYTV